LPHPPHWSRRDQPISSLTALYVDLHLHTTHSDGRWEPRRVVEEASSRGLAAIAITDHDVVSGLAEARDAAAELEIELLDGVELTADWNGKVCHILGYGVGAENGQLRSALERGKRQMAAHVGEVLEAVRAAGHELGEQDLSRYNTRYATGTSLVLGMLERGILRHSTQARRLLAMAASQPRAYTAEEAIQLIHEAGGLAVLAHPARVAGRGRLLEAKAFRPLVDTGLDGLEVWHIVQNEGAREHYRALAARLGLLATGGSDCHGPRSSGVRIGSQRVPYEVVTELRERLSDLRRTASGPT
jgi:3',5'-nucleoside bisphosphate phosphatase